MMVCVDSRFVCHLCKERALGSTERYQLRQGIDPERLRFWGIVLTVVAVVGVVGFRMFVRDAVRSQGPAAAASAVTEAESWADKDPAGWPAFLLANQIEASAPQWRVAPNAFLIQRPDGVILGATAMIGENSTTEAPPAKPFAFTSWKLTGTGGQSTPAGKIVSSAEPLLERGILLATIEKSGDLPVTPLKLRTSGYSANVRMKIVVANGAGGAPKVYPVSVRNNESSDDTQILTVEKNLLSGRQRVLGMSGDGSNSLFELEEKVRVEDLVGAPVIDAFGHVAAIVTGPDNGVAREGMARRVRGFGMDALQRAVEGDAVSR
jgi:hypothetical protein